MTLQERLTAVIEDNYECSNGAEVLNCPHIAQAVVDALPECVPDLYFQKVSLTPPSYDAGALPTGWYKVRYNGVENCWLALRGHMVIVGRAESPEDAFAVANAHHRAAVITALMGEA